MITLCYFSPFLFGLMAVVIALPARVSQPADFVEFVADMDLIVAVSACPVGDYAVPMTEPDKITTRPLGFEIYNT